VQSGQPCAPGIGSGIGMMRDRIALPNRRARTSADTLKVQLRRVIS